jgi:hypothetical protein
MWVVPSWGSFSFAYGPVVATVVLVALVVVLRWAAGRGQSVVAAGARPGAPSDYGVLVAVAAPRSQQQADQLQRDLAQRDIACTVARTTQGLRLMVWPDQEAAARSVIGSQA